MYQPCSQLCRLSTVQAAHSIVVMHKGSVAETGTHEALVAQGGMYANLVRRQMTSRSKPNLASNGSSASLAL
jgi:ABC-type microcin C transport system duplicated ATPase subunit YejF